MPSPWDAGPVRLARVSLVAVQNFCVDEADSARGSSGRGEEGDSRGRDWHRSKLKEVRPEVQMSEEADDLVVRASATLRRRGGALQSSGDENISRPSDGDGNSAECRWNTAEAPLGLRFRGTADFAEASWRRSTADCSVSSSGPSDDNRAVGVVVDDDGLVADTKTAILTGSGEAVMRGRWAHVGQVELLGEGREVSLAVQVELVSARGCNPGDPSSRSEVGGVLSRWLGSQQRVIVSPAGSVGALGVPRREFVRVPLRREVSLGGSFSHGSEAAERNAIGQPVLLVAVDFVPSTSDLEEVHEGLRRRIGLLINRAVARRAASELKDAEDHRWTAPIDSHGKDSDDGTSESSSEVSAEDNLQDEGKQLEGYDDDPDGGGGGGGGGDDDGDNDGDDYHADVGYVEDGYVKATLSNATQSYAPSSTGTGLPTPASPSLTLYETPLVQRFDLNERFQRICDLRQMMRDNAVDFESKTMLNEELLSVAVEFEDIVKLYGRIICTERHLPAELKTVKPAPQLGGVAGGAKFIVQGVLFKFCDDGFNIYGSTTAAAKAAGHDLRALAFIFNHPLRGGGAGGVRVPLASLYDFRGYRLIAVAMLPIRGSSSLVYGSADGARTLYTSDTEVFDLMEALGEKLNLAPHTVGLRVEEANGARELPTARIRFCADIEAHRGDDHRIYALDFARVFPPTKPEVGVKASALIRVFRPEFVVAHRVEMCCDGFSRFLRADPDRSAHEMILAAATNDLTTITVATCAKRLEELLVRWTAARLGFRSYHRRMLVSTIHASGVNLRLLGAVADHCGTALKQLCFSEILARTLKNCFREELLRASHADAVGLSDASLSQIVCGFLNRFFGGMRDAKSSKQRQRALKKMTISNGVEPPPAAANPYVPMPQDDCTDLVTVLITRCCRDYAVVEGSSVVALKSFASGVLHGNMTGVPNAGINVNWRLMLLARFLELSGITLELSTLAYLFQGSQLSGLAAERDSTGDTTGPRWLPLRPEDVVNIGERLKPMGVVDHALAYTLKIRVWDGTDAQRDREAFLVQREHIVKRAMHSIMSALHSDPTSIVTLRNAAQLFAARDAFAQGFDQRVLLSKLPIRVSSPSFFVSEFFLLRAQSTAPRVSETLFQLGLLYVAVEDFFRALGFLLEAAELASDVLERSFVFAETLGRSFAANSERACAPPLPWLSSDMAIELSTKLLDAFPDVNPE